MPRAKFTSAGYMSHPPDTFGHFWTRAGYWAVLHIETLETASGVFKSGLACTWTLRVIETGNFGTRAGSLTLIKPMR
jgi:hypothetical protein